MNLATQPTPEIHSFESLQPGVKTEFPFVVSKDQMTAFSNLSGDYNPLHLDDSFAKSKGFSGAVVYGALLVGQISRLIGMHIPGRDSVWSDLEIQFVSPLYVGENARLHAEVSHLSEAVAAVKLKLNIKVGERLIARGKVMVTVK